MDVTMPCDLVRNTSLVFRGAVGGGDSAATDVDIYPSPPQDSHDFDSVMALVRKTCQQPHPPQAPHYSRAQAPTFLRQPLARISAQEALRPQQQPQQQPQQPPTRQPTPEAKKKTPSATLPPTTTVTCKKCGLELSSKCLMNTCSPSEVACRKCGRELSTKCILSMCC